MKTSLKLLLAALLAASLGLFLSQNLRDKDPGHSTSPSTSSQIPTPNRYRDNLAELNSFRTSLANSSSAKDARQVLSELRTWLLSLDPAEAALLVEDFLAEKRDASLPFEFTLGNNGFLETPPTLRVALLDFLGFIHPEEAARISRQILDTPTHPDEWAIALRNVARGESPATNAPFLQAKALELINNPDWQAEPSIGYLNTFDVLVHTRATDATPILSGFLQNKDRRDLAHASFLTLDRLTQLEPETMLATLLEDPALQSARPGMMAQQFARANLANEAQRHLVEQWLLSPHRTDLELQTFADSYPNLNQMVSNNLLSPRSPPLSPGDPAAIHAALSTWLAKPEFSALEHHLSNILQRLDSSPIAPCQ